MIVTNEPWRHSISDNFFTPDKLQEILDYVEGYDVTKETYIENKFTSSLYPCNNLLIEQLTQTFPDHRFFNKLKFRQYIVIMPENTSYVKGIHCDKYEKVFSNIIYISPEQSKSGTLLYDSNKNFVKRIDWKQNRCLSFAPLDNVTWHNFDNLEKHNRVTVNITIER